ncbi:MAG: hypothetical protein ACLR6J_06095 [Parabacteroides merdae]
MHSYFASAAYYGDNTLIRFQTFGSIEKTYQAWTGVPSYLLDSDRTYNPCGEYKEDGVTKYYKNQTDNYRQQNYHLTASQRLSDLWNMNLTLHYTHGAGYYEDYKGGAKKSRTTNCPHSIDSQGDTIAKTDLVRRKWLENDFYGAIYSANHRGECRLQFSSRSRHQPSRRRPLRARVMWAKQSNNLPEPDYEYYRNTGDKLDYNMYAKANYQFHPNLNGWPGHAVPGHPLHDRRQRRQSAGDHVNVDKHWNFFSTPRRRYTSRRTVTQRVRLVLGSQPRTEPGQLHQRPAGTNARSTRRSYDYEAVTVSKLPFHVGANLYFMDYSNQPDPDRQDQRNRRSPSPGAIRDSYRMGIEPHGSARKSPAGWTGAET